MLFAPRGGNLKCSVEPFRRLVPTTGTLSVSWLWSPLPAYTSGPCAICLHLRSLRYLPGFLWHTLQSARQVQRAPGFLGGVLAGDKALGSWTITAWTSEAAMRDYRNTDAHFRAMPKLLPWADEASFVHWEQESPPLPSMEETLRRLVTEGKRSKVNHPSPSHAAQQIAAELPRVGRRLRPAGQPD